MPAFGAEVRFGPQFDAGTEKRPAGSASHQTFKEEYHAVLVTGWRLVKFLSNDLHFCPAHQTVDMVRGITGCKQNVSSPIPVHPLLNHLRLVFPALSSQKINVEIYAPLVQEFRPIRIVAPRDQFLMPLPVPLFTVTAELHRLTVVFVDVMLFML
jgi:hypothetical protein